MAQNFRSFAPSCEVYRYLIINLESFSGTLPDVHIGKILRYREIVSFGREKKPSFRGSLLLKRTQAELDLRISSRPIHLLVHISTLQILFDHKVTPFSRRTSAY